MTTVTNTRWPWAANVGKRRKGIRLGPVFIAGEETFIICAAVVCAAILICL